MMHSQHLFNLKSALHLSIEDDMYVELLKVRLWNDLIHFPYSLISNQHKNILASS